jgi:hypothetical protein
MLYSNRAEESMVGYLPEDWVNKQVTVVFEREVNMATWIVAKLLSDNEGGINIEQSEDLSVRRMFVPWSSVRFVEGLSEPHNSESQSGKA